jgi:hypothetical protein
MTFYITNQNPQTQTDKTLIGRGPTTSVSKMYMSNYNKIRNRSMGQEAKHICNLK